MIIAFVTIAYICRSELWYGQEGSTKKLVIFDLDGTLAESKSSLDREMATLLGQLLDLARVAIISGGDWSQFEQQILANLPDGASLERLSLLPTCGTRFFRYDGSWEKAYSEDLTPEQQAKITE